MKNKDKAKWTEAKNARRFALIEKQVDGKLTSDDRDELDQLQTEMLAYRREIAPQVSDELDDLYQQYVVDADPDKFDPDNLVAGNVIVMWDGKEFGEYADLSAAIQDVKIRITRKNCHTLPDDFKCLEFLEVLDEDAGSHRDFTGSGRGCRNEHGTRISFGYPVKELGNQIEQLTKGKK